LIENKYVNRKLKKERGRVIPPFERKGRFATCATVCEDTRFYSIYIAKTK
jgi:hypothetical protein